MKYHLVLCGTLSFLLIFSRTASATAALKPNYDDVRAQTKNFVPRHSATLTCNGTDLMEKAEVKWSKDDQPVEDLKELKGRITTSKSGTLYKLTIRATVEDDAGTYTCHTEEDGERISGSVILARKMGVKVVTNINVVEGEKLRIPCNVVGRPTPRLSWTYRNDTYNTTIDPGKDNGRYILEMDPEKQIENAILKVEDIQMYDRGVFTCIGRSEVEKDKEVSSECMVRIKDKYAALWPFLGICAEVFVLCAIIFIYEKKRNKTELEESDTDPGEQKNTPDHGKDSNLRHRPQ